MRGRGELGGGSWKTEFRFRAALSLATLVCLIQPVLSQSVTYRAQHGRVHVPVHGVRNEVHRISAPLDSALVKSRVTTSLEIFEIQGSGLSSPFENQMVSTENNVVTAVAPNGFFMQTPVARTDGDAETSDGLFVFTGSTPSPAVGDLVNVTGLVQEFFGLTEFSSSPSVSIVSSGNSLPMPVELDAVTPSPNQPQPANEIERFEGMLVKVTNGRVTAPTDQFGELDLVAGPSRTFREKGIRFPGLPGLPVWDGNPEIFEINPDALGLPQLDITANSQVQSAVGPLTFSFGDYVLLPLELTLSQNILPQPVRGREPGEFTIATQNLERLDEQALDFATRMTKLSSHIRDVLQAPDILAVQEVDNLSTLQALANRIEADDPGIVYSAFLEEGNDVGGIDIGFLLRNTVQVNSVMQLGKDVTFEFGGQTFLLHDRPPLVLDGQFVNVGVEFPITVMVVHNRSLGGIEGSDGTRIRTKRFEQARWIAQRIQEMQVANPDTHLVVVGDFNAFEFTDGYVDVMGQISGTLDPDGALFAGTDEVNPDLTNQILNLPSEERYSFIFEGSAQTLDHILTTQALSPHLTHRAFARGNADAPRSFQGVAATALRSSDHDGMVLYLRPGGDPDGIGISGSVTYALTGELVRDVTVTLSGGPSGVQMTDENGAYSFGGLQAGLDYTVTPSKVGDSAPFSIGCFDAALMAQHAVGLIILSSEQQLASDVDENGMVQTFDAALACRFAVGLPAFGASDKTGEWRFQPTDRSYLPLDTEQTAQDFTAILLGDVDGNWRSANAGATVLAKGGASRLGFGEETEWSADGSKMTTSLHFDGSLAAWSFDLELSYDPEALRYLGAIRVPEGWEVFANSQDAGHLRLGMFSTTPLAKASEFVRVKWEVLKEGEATEVWLEGALVNDEPQATTSLTTQLNPIPTEFTLQQNYPNPFNPTTTIEYRLPEATRVTIKVFSILGQEVRTLIDLDMEAGFHSVTWNGRDSGGKRVASGVYIYRIKAGEFVDSKKLTLLQ